jgi:hypothetical protein
MILLAINVAILDKLTCSTCLKTDYLACLAATIGTAGAVDLDVHRDNNAKNGLLEVKVACVCRGKVTTRLSPCFAGS